MRLYRTPLLLENVTEAPGHPRAGTRFLQLRKPAEERHVRAFQRQVGFKPGKFQRTRDLGVRVDQQARSAIRELPKKERVIENPRVAKEVDRQRFMTKKLQRQAQAISRSLPFSETLDVGPYSPPTKRHEKSDFPRELGSPEHRALMNKVLHYVRRTGKAFGGKYDPDMDQTYGRVGFSFGGDRDMSDAYHEHLQRNLPWSIADAIRRERFDHDNNRGDPDHAHEITHRELWHAVNNHLQMQRRRAERRNRRRHAR